MNQFSDRLTQMRKAQNLNQTQLAKRIGISQPFMAELESGSKNPSVEVLQKLCDALGCSADYLLGITTVKNMRLLKEEPEGGKGGGLTMEMLQEMADRSITPDEFKLALKVARVMNAEKDRKDR